MIVFVGPLADSGAANVALLLASRGERILVLDPRIMGTHWDIDWCITSEGLSGEIRTTKRSYPIEDIRAIWAHMVMLPDRADDPDSVGSEGQSLEHFSNLIAFVDSFPGLVINRPSVASTNSVKPYQARLIQEVGFPPIPSIITTDPNAARAFYEAHDGNVIYKSISWRRSIVRRLREEDLNLLNRTVNCPTQFQKYIDGNDIRVHLVGDRVFATEISANADDYRYVPLQGERLMHPITLPADMEDRCVALGRALEMDVSGIDLRRDAQGTHYCFEANPIPGYLFYERYTGQRIGDAMAEFVCDAIGRPSTLGIA